MARAMSFFRYPGGKSKIADKIIQSLYEMAGDGEVEYREPFFGGGGIGLGLLHQHSGVVKSIWINDKDVGISCLWTSVIKHPELFKELVRRFRPSVDEFHSLREELVKIDQMPTDDEQVVKIGFKKLAIHQISYSGLGTKSGGPLGGEKQESKYKIDCRWSPDYICRKIDQLHARLGETAIRHGGCTNLDFADVINDTSGPSLLYLDPPYFVKGNDLYQCGFTEKDHIRLFDALKWTEHPWVLSYDDCDEVRGLYGWWAVVEPVDVNYSITAIKDNDTGARLSRTKSEVLIYPKRLEGVYHGNGVVPASVCAAGS